MTRIPDWSYRYQIQDTPWDMGVVSPPLVARLQLLRHREQQILIPGAGRAYEAAWLWNNGYKNVHVLDLAPESFDWLRAHVPGFPWEQMHVEDFFQHERQYDIVVEQTFFCALDPEWREKYVRHMARILKPGGRLFGVLFDFPLDDGPPFGGSAGEYQKLFREYFRIYKLERCYNSIPPRQGSELYFEILKINGNPV